MQIAFIGFYDLSLYVKTKLLRENPIGVYVGICKKVEKKWFFRNTIAGGYCGWAIIRLYSSNKEMRVITEDTVTDILNHEVLHQVIDKIEDSKTCHALDNIHKMFWSIDKKGHGCFTILFSLTKNGKTELIS